MERGPMALFGAIVAMGLGPAMWLGAQFGQVALTPDRPPAVTTVQNEVGAPGGGTGAGDEPADAEVIRTEPKAVTKPLNRTRDARPTATRSASPSPSPSDEPSKPPVEPSAPSSAEPGDDETVPSTEPSTPADDPPPPSDGDEEPVPPPLPPDPQTGSGPATADRSLI